MDNTNEIDYDLILKNLKKKGFGDISYGRFEDFESTKDFDGTENTNEYYKKFYTYLKKESLGEVEKKTISIYDRDKDKPEEITKAVKRAKEGDVSFNDDGTISVKENNLKEVEKTQVLKFDIKNGSDVESLQKTLNKGVDSKKISVGTDGTISISENVNKYNKINLSESDIMDIIVKNNKNQIFKKSDLLENVKKRIISEANMNDNVRRSFESGDNDYRDILGQELTNRLAQDSFREISDSIRTKTGKQNVTLNDVQSLLSNSLVEAAKEEYRLGTDRLERKAVDMIRKQFNIPLDSVDFDAKITGIPPKMITGTDMSPQEMESLSRQYGFKIGKINREGLKMSKGSVRPPQNKSEEELKPKIKRRRLTNAMMHGAARKSQNLYHLDDQLRQENPNLGRHYSNLMAANDANYFLLDNDTIKREGESGVHAGNVRVNLSGERPKIIAQGMVFPILLHELAKGVVELMSLWSLPEDKEIRDYVLDKTDNLESETNDIRLGTKIWEKFVAQIPVDNQEVISLTWNMLQELPDNEFNGIIEGLLSGKTDAETKVGRMAEEALYEIRSEQAEDYFGGYEDSENVDKDEDDDVVEPEDEEDKEDEVLKSLLNKNNDDDTIDYESMSKRELEMELDAALDAGDMDLVRYLGSILNKK